MANGLKNLQLVKNKVKLDLQWVLRLKPPYPFLAFGNTKPTTQVPLQFASESFSHTIVHSTQTGLEPHASSLLWGIGDILFQLAYNRILLNHLIQRITNVEAAIRKIARAWCASCSPNYLTKEAGLLTFLLLDPLL